MTDEPKKEKELTAEEFRNDALNKGLPKNLYQFDYLMRRCGDLRAKEERKAVYKEIYLYIKAVVETGISLAISLFVLFMMKMMAIGLMTYYIPLARLGCL